MTSASLGRLTWVKRDFWNKWRRIRSFLVLIRLFKNHEWWESWMTCSMIWHPENSEIIDNDWSLKFRLIIQLSLNFEKFLQHSRRRQLVHLACLALRTPKFPSFTGRKEPSEISKPDRGTVACVVKFLLIDYSPMSEGLGLFLLITYCHQCCHLFWSCVVSLCHLLANWSLSKKSTGIFKIIQMSLKSFEMCPFPRTDELSAVLHALTREAVTLFCHEICEMHHDGSLVLSETDNLKMNLFFIMLSTLAPPGLLGSLSLFVLDKDK